MKNAYAMTADILTNLRSIMDANKMRGNQTFIFTSNNRKVVGIRVLDLNPKSKEKLIKLVAENFQDKMTLVKETPTTMCYSCFCEDDMLIQRMQRNQMLKIKFPEKNINKHELINALNEMPVDVLKMLNDKFNWHFDMTDGKITNVVKGG